MNERELSLVKHIGEAVSDHLKSMSEDFTNKLEQHRKRIDERLDALTQSLNALDVPDVKTMISEALSALPAPVMPDIPDVAQLVKESVSNIELPKAPELPDIDKMVDEALSKLTLPKPELPDFQKMIADEISLVLEKLPAATNGEDGKDALQLEILPDIDEEKSYPRGTYATHKSGLWRSFQKTAGMKGWECLVGGLEQIGLAQKNAREFTVSLMMSGGQTVEKSFALPVMIYRGVFKSGEAYQAGDTVTWGGSLWHCDADTEDKPGELGTKGWTLAAKRGRDGKDKSHA